MTAHGTRTEYAAGCRCDPCRKAYGRSVRAAAAATVLDGISPNEFGPWRDHAACVGSGVDFFPVPPSEDGVHGHRSADPEYRRKVNVAKAVCNGCPVKGECLAAAMESSWFRDFGIRGGLTASEREQVRRGKRAV